MDRLPIEILELIFDKILWENPEELFHLRAVSHTWKSVVERSRSKIFKYWQNRCQTEIPEDHLMDIVREKYPLIAHPWQEFYWVDCGLPHVAKNVYNIWKSFPDVKSVAADKTKHIMNWTINDVLESPKKCVVGINHEYIAISPPDGAFRDGITRIYRWDNLREPIKQYHCTGGKIDFYKTAKGTFVIWAELGQINYNLVISKHPVDDNLVQRFTLLFSLGNADMYFITQNECFYVINDDYRLTRTVEHRVLTAEHNDFQTSTVIGQPFDQRGDWCRVEIRDSTLYIAQIGPVKMQIRTYKISRNSDGKLSFTDENVKVLSYEIRPQYPGSYAHVHKHYENEVNIDNPSLIGSACAVEKFHSWIWNVCDTDATPLAVHANYIFNEYYCVDVYIFEVDDVMKRVKADTYENPIGGEIKIARVDCINWIRIIYVGSKAKILMSYDDTLGLIDFY